MMLQGQAIKAYAEYMNKSMTSKPKEIKPKVEGLLSRNKPVEDTENKAGDSYAMEQFNEIKKLRAGINNG